MAVPTYPEQSQSTTSLVFGILGLVCCPFFGIAAWVMGNNELQGITAGRRDPANLGTAKAARILGIVGTVLLTVSVVFWILLALGTIATELPFLDQL